MKVPALFAALSSSTYIFAGAIDIRQIPNGMSQMVDFPHGAPAKDEKPDCHVPSRYYGISLNIRLNSVEERLPDYGRAPVELNKLTSYTVNASEISFDPDVSEGVDIETVACQVYTDADGIEPIGYPIGVQDPLVLDDYGVVSIGSILCSVRGDLTRSR